MNIRGKIQEFWIDQSGATMVEYGLLIALLTAVGVFAAARVGAVNVQTFTKISNALSG